MLQNLGVSMAFGRTFKENHIKSICFHPTLGYDVQFNGCIWVSIHSSISMIPIENPADPSSSSSRNDQKMPRRVSDFRTSSRHAGHEKVESSEHHPMLRLLLGLSLSVLVHRPLAGLGRENFPMEIPCCCRKPGAVFSG